jgi:hypothetical protein
MQQTSNKIAAMPSSVHRLLNAAILAAAVTIPAAPAMGWAADRTADEIPQSVAIVEVAIVKVEVKLESGKVIKHDGVLFEWGDEGNVVLKYDDHTHDVALKVDRTDDSGKAIKLTVGYARDGESIIQPQTVSTEAKKREVIRIEGGSAIALTVTPKKVKLDENGNPVEPIPPDEPKPKEKDKPKEQKPKAPVQPAPPPEPPKRPKLKGPDSNDPLEGVK